MKFVIFHGSFGHPGEHWFPLVKEKLEAIGQTVIAPTFPCEDWDEMTKFGPTVVPKYQNLINWLKVFDETFQALDKNEPLCFIGQSLGPLFILHIIEKYNIQLDSAIFASPFLDSLDRFWQADSVNRTFYKTDFDFNALQKLIPTSYALFSDNDPYVDREKSLLFAQKMNSSQIFIKGGGHINNILNAPLVYELCKTRMNMNDIIAPHGQDFQ